MKKGFLKKLAALCLLAVMVTGALCTALTSEAATQAEVDKLKNQLASVTSQKNKLKKELTSLKNQQATMAQKIEILDNKLAAAEEEMELQKQLIEKINELVAEKEEELRKSEARVDAQYDTMKTRIRFMAEHGNVSYLSILLSATDFSDFLTKYEVIKQITSYDGNMLDNYREICVTVEQQKKDYEEALEEAETQEKILEQQRLEYESEIAQREQTMIELQEQERQTQSEYNSIAKQEDELSASIAKMVKELSSGIYVGGSMQWPLPAANNVVTCKFGMRTHPITGVYKLHTGVDLRATKGTKIYAANAGTVLKSEYNTAYGNYVLIDHGGGIATLYAHMSSRKVTKGQKVKQGDVIGLVGSTGYSTGPHLHFEVIINGEYTNPIKQ